MERTVWLDTCRTHFQLPTLHPHLRKKVKTVRQSKVEEQMVDASNVRKLV
jgi:hypothetical protein